MNEKETFYYQNPLKCGQCESVIDYYKFKIKIKCHKKNKSGKVFCSRQCKTRYYFNDKSRHLGEKICKTCGETKPKSDYYFANKQKTVYAISCKKCIKIESAERNRNNPERANILRRCVYGIEPEDFEFLLTKQNKVCAICRNKNKLCIDHDHDTGKVRGLLCHSCNMGLGAFKDSITSLTNAIGYLEQK